LPTTAFSVTATPRADSSLESSVQSIQQLNVTIDNNEALQVNSTDTNNEVEINVSSKTNEILNKEENVKQQEDIQDINRNDLEISDEVVQEREQSLMAENDVYAENDEIINKSENITQQEDPEEIDLKLLEVSDEEVQEKEESLKAAVQEVQSEFSKASEELDFKSVSKASDKLIEMAPQIAEGFVFTSISREFWNDVRRRKHFYISDWVDGFKKPRQTLPAILFLYFACLAPAISFGTIAFQTTKGAIGVVEFILSCGLAGTAYSVMCGQPMGFIAPTGLTLAFISGLFKFCTLNKLPFFPIYTWVGLWTGAFMTLLGLGGSSKLIKLCTHFTDEVFNALLSVNFIYEALKSLERNFRMADPSNLTMPFVALAMAWATFWSTMKVNAVATSRYFNENVRQLFKDFGPVLIIVFMTLINQTKFMRNVGLPRLTLPKSLELAGGRSLIVPFMSIPLKVKLLCSLPAVLLTSLFFMDQNISIRLVNNPKNKLKKGEAYNLDMVALGLITSALSVVGLPWMCGATVQSMNHIRAMTRTTFNEETGSVEIAEVIESRATGFVVHTMITCTIFLLGVLKYLPTPIFSGIFLFLGRKLMTGNSFLVRIKDSIAEKNRLPENHPIQVLGKTKMNLFTAIQAACLMGLWAFKQNPATSIFFPSAIGLLMLIRAFVLPKFFTEEELTSLGDPTPSLQA